MALTVAMRTRLPSKAALAEEIVGPKYSYDHASLPLLGNDHNFDLAPLNVKNGIRGLALRVNNLILSIIGYGSSAVHFRQKRFWIEWERLFAFHSRPFNRERGYSRAQIATKFRGSSRRDINEPASRMAGFYHVPMTAPILERKNKIPLEGSRQPVTDANSGPVGAWCR